MKVKNFGFDFYIARDKTLSEEGLGLSPPTGSNFWLNKPEGGKMLWGSSNRKEYDFQGDTYWLEWTRINWDTVYNEYKYLYKMTIDMSSVFAIRDYYDDYQMIDKRFLEAKSTNDVEWYYLNFQAIAKYYGGFYLSASAADSGSALESYTHYIDGTFMKNFRAWATEQVVIWDESIMKVTGVYSFDPETRQVTEMKGKGYSDKSLFYMGLL